MAKLGQHFLKNKTKLRKIVEALELKDGDVVIEIGPGHGELTDELRSANHKLKIIAIEKDEELAESLKEKFKNNKNIKIIEGDALKLLPQLTDDQRLTIYDKRLTTDNYKIAGNIPYYITGYLFRILGELENKPSLIVLLIQKEVAERVCARPPKMSLLAASVQFWAEPKIISNVSKKDFRPAPKVDSAIIKLSPTRKYAEQNAEKRGKYYSLVKILFKQPRKTIVNNLVLSIKYQVSGVNKKEKIIEKLREIGIEPNARPQDLSVEEIVKLIKLIKGSHELI